MLLFLSPPGMNALPDTVVDDHQGSKWVGPPTAEKSVKAETDQDSSSKIGIDGQTTLSY